MMRLAFAVLVLLAGLAVGFWFVPVAEVAPTRVAETAYPATERARTYFETQRAGGLLEVPEPAPAAEPEPLPPPKSIPVEKSPWRRSIEGRLKWLGLADEIVVELPCVTRADGSRTCRRLL